MKCLCLDQTSDGEGDREKRRKDFEEKGIDIFIQQVGVKFLYDHGDKFQERVKHFLLNFRK